MKAHENKSPLSQDQIRDAILRFLLGLHTKAKGVSSLSAGIRDIAGAMKPLGISLSDTSSNLDYLVQKDWVAEIHRERTFQTARGAKYSSDSVKYKISALGMDRFQAASTFRRDENFSRINVTNINGVTVIGNHNVVNTQYAELAKALNELEKAITGAPNIKEEEKLNVASDIETIQAQLSKPSPNPGIIKTLWTGIEIAVTAAEFVTLVSHVKHLMHPLIG
jgi:hypothetical protein